MKTDKMIRCWMPISKGLDGEFVGILSDDSIDRDGEFMTKELLQSWAMNKNVLPMLANHENKIEKLVGGWTDKRLISKGKNNALTAKPFFLESNPLGRQTKAMVEEALSKGLNVGISIGAIPHETVKKEMDGKEHLGYKSAEIVEATIVPIQSNRNASFTSLAKSFDIEVNKLEGSKMSEQITKEIPEEVQQEEAVAEVVEEVKEEVKEVVEEVNPEVKVEAEPVVEEKAEEVPAVDPQVIVDENKSLKEDVLRLTKELRILKVRQL